MVASEIKSNLGRISPRLLFFSFSVAYLILAMHLPVSIYTIWGHDDALFWNNAYQIVSGNWLGAYNQMTLAKGPGFPLFLALNAALGIPVTLLIASFYLLACWLIVNTLRDLGFNKYFVLVVFAVLLFHPALFPVRIIRDNIYPALSLIIISGVLRLAFVPLPQDRRLVRIIPYGLVLGLFWVTREEGIWIVPALLLLVLIKVIQLIKQKLPVTDLFYRFACFIFVATIFVSSIALINYHKYGKFEVVDFKSKEFSRVLKSLNSVDIGQDLPYLPVSFNKRQEIYKISPSFLQLKNYFEDKGKGWTVHGCTVCPWTCGDYHGAQFMWALRDGAAVQGYYENPMRAANFYKNITKEIEKSCDLGLIKCKTNPVPFMPNITIDQLKEFPGKTVEVLKLAMVQLPVAETAGHSWEPLDQLQRIRFFLGNPRTTPALSEQNIKLTGWYYSPHASDWITLNCLVGGKIVKREIDRLNSPDIADHFKNPNAKFQRFSFSVQGNEDCSIFADCSSSNVFQIKALINRQKEGLNCGRDGTLYFDEISQTRDYPGQKLFFKIKNSLAELYKLIIPAFVLLGVMIYFSCLIFILRGKMLITDIFIASTIMWCLFFSRILLMVLVDISSFPAINVLYMSAAFPILCLASFLSLQLMFEFIFRSEKVSS